MGSTQQKCRHTHHTGHMTSVRQANCPECRVLHTICCLLDVGHLRLKRTVPALVLLPSLAHHAMVPSRTSPLPPPLGPITLPRKLGTTTGCSKGKLQCPAAGIQKLPFNQRVSWDDCQRPWLVISSIEC